MVRPSAYSVKASKQNEPPFQNSGSSGSLGAGALLSVGLHAVLIGFIIFGLPIFWQPEVLPGAIGIELAQLSDITAAPKVQKEGKPNKQPDLSSLPRDVPWAGTDESGKGDYFGPSVNLATRLTDLARPWSVLAAEELVDELSDSFEVRRIRPTRIRGVGLRRPLAVTAPAED